jgi:hypothetical protein
MSERCERWLYHSFSFLGCALMVAAVYCYFWPPDAGVDAALPNLLEVAETDLELSDCVPGQKRTVVFRLDNRSGKPMRVLGLSEC